MMKTPLILALLALALSGCAATGSNSISNANQQLAGNKAPYRFVKTEESESHTAYELQPAGEKRPSVVFASEVLAADVFKSIKEQCGFQKSDLVETRAVSHQPPSFYEAWVFNDPKSESKEKQSAISVLLYQHTNMGGVDISLSTNCHHKPSKLIFGK
ncbi:MAG: hypothetical protein ACQES2_09620 [Pseudomonadota bacterium]